MRTAGVLALVATAALAAVGCGDDSAEPKSSSAPVVTITATGYEPRSLVVAPGARVKFVNRDEDGPHSAKDERRGEVEVSPQPGPTPHDGSEVNRAGRVGFATHALFPGEAQTVVFPAVGRYVYQCAFSEMTGTIEVRADKGAPEP